MIFLERPITARHIREICARFNEGVRVEYKGTFDANVRSHIPKIVSSFANSQGGVMIVGVPAVNGVPGAQIDGFEPPAREELALTVESICLQNIQPPVLPRTQIVQSDVPDRVFLVIEVDESAEAPHAIENSKRVYVRTGNAANPYDLAEVDLIIDLLRRRGEPTERRDRILRSAEQRSEQSVPRSQPYFQVSACPQFPRMSLASSHEVWDFLLKTTYAPEGLAAANSLKRVPDGAASLVYTTQRVPAQYVELNKYGLLYAARHFAQVRAHPDLSSELHFLGLLQVLLRLTSTAGSFYSAVGYRGSLLVRASVHMVSGQIMRFVSGNAYAGVDLEESRCFAESVTAERLVGVDHLQERRVDVLTDILSEITWAFWQSNQEHPTARLRKTIEQAW
jgi:Schlafen, AlbA_2